MLGRKLNRLKRILKDMKSVLVAYSGGVDSTFLLKVSKDVLEKKIFAVIAVSETYTGEELKGAIKTVKKLKVPYKVIKTEELKNKAFAKNPVNRCYYCKKELFFKLRSIAKAKGIQFVVDGTNKDDTGDFRPGMKALKELKVRSPLKEAGLKKSEIRRISRKMNLLTWNKPSLACLSSRIPYGTKINTEILKKIEKAERIIKKTGIIQVRARYHENLIRIEIPKGEVPVFVRSKRIEKIVKSLKNIGFNYITLDLEGYRTGSMNEVLSRAKKG